MSAEISEGVPEFVINGPVDGFQVLNNANEFYPGTDQPYPNFLDSHGAPGPDLTIFRQDSTVQQLMQSGASVKGIFFEPVSGVDTEGTVQQAPTTFTQVPIM
jgi:hypothetical protein